MEGRRFSDGLHQALEAKEKVTIQPENQTLASITFQNYFRLYNKLSGMTGTASTEAEEFWKIYKLEVVEIPTNKTMLRKDSSDLIFKDQKSKMSAKVMHGRLPASGSCQQLPTTCRASGCTHGGRRAAWRSLPGVAMRACIQPCTRGC